MDKTLYILDAAADCFMERGFEATKIDDIADRLGATKGLIYYSFRSKVDIFFAVYRRALHNTLSNVQPFLNDGSRSAERLTNMSIAHITLLMRALGYHHVAQQGIEMRLSMALKPQQRIALRELIALRDEYEMIFRRVIEQGIADGEIAEVNVSLAAKTLLGGLNGVSMWYKPRPGESEADREALARAVVAMLMKGLEARPAPAVEGLLGHSA